jgi:death on curing protein
MRYLTLTEILSLHALLLTQTGGANGIRDLGGLESAIAQPMMTFGERELYPTLATKAAALCFSLVMNHPFVDGNKRIGHAAMETFLALNHFQLAADIDSSESTILTLAAGNLTREQLVAWVTANLQTYKQ